MKTYLVGGAVRDALMSRASNTPEASHVDRDWVVVGATPEAMVQQGFLPVGRDFPVFLHPVTREEYALARTERKSSPGYRGFVVHSEPGVTLEDDLARRDLTINAMAVAADQANDPASAQIIDPHQRPARPAATRAAPRDRRIHRRPRAHLATGALRGAFSRFFGGTRNAGFDAAHGGARRGRPPGGRTRVAGTRARPDGTAAQSHVRRAAVRTLRCP